MIHKATSDDLEAIFSLYVANSLDISRVTNPTYAANVQKDGFLIALDNKDDINKRIQTNFLFNVYKIEGKVVSFININKEIYFPEDADNIIWFKNSFYKNYYHSKGAITLHEIIVDQNFKGKGIGKSLLEDSLKTLKEKGYTDLFSIVAFGPLTNCASLLFHAKNGFERACVSMPDNLFGLQNYQSVLFHRNV